MKSTIRLFNALPIEHKGVAKHSDALLRKTLQRGFIFSSEVVCNYSEQELLQFADEIQLTSEQMNSSFHKSWKKIREADITQLLLEQLVHYITTYGFEKLEMYDERSVYIPTEELEIPEMDTDKLPLLIIKGYTKEELKSKLLNLLQTGIALSDATINDILDIAKYVELCDEDIVSIKNREVKISLYDNLGMIPQNPIEFLRYAIFKSTKKTLLIKDAATIEAIKAGGDVSNLFVKYKREYGLYRLAEIFYRFKPLFLAFRGNSDLKPLINKIRKLAPAYHKPMQGDYLNNLSAMIKRGFFDPTKLQEELKNVNQFRKIRLAYALKYRTRDVNSILYRIRNGKSYASDFKFDNRYGAGMAMDIVLKSIVDNINVTDKKIYIPNYMVYALPATEKQFTGNFPSGSYISIPHDMVVGVHWENVNDHRIDLDLSLLAEDNRKFGWDSEYRNEGRTILFSGDMTDASHGASELFYIEKQNNTNFLMFVNYYNYNHEIEVPFKIMVARECVTNFGMNYMINPNNVMAIATSSINQKQKMLGFLEVTPDGSRFYFAESYLGKSITSRGKQYVAQGMEYLSVFYKHTITLNEVLKMAGADLVDEKESCDIDLSPEVIEKSIIINLLLGIVK